MITNAATKELLDCKPGMEIVCCNSEDYYSAANPQYIEVCDIVKDNNKLIILTR